jgi:hypothetical protein
VYPYTGIGRKESTLELAKPVAKHPLSSSNRNSAHAQSSSTIDRLGNEPPRHGSTTTTATAQEQKQGREPPTEEEERSENPIIKVLKYSQAVFFLVFSDGFVSYMLCCSIWWIMVGGFTNFFMQAVDFIFIFWCKIWQSFDSQRV